MPDQFQWYVYTTPKSPAAQATIDKLTALGIKFEQRPLGHARNVMRIRGFKLSPVVIVWVRTRRGRSVYLSWEGHQPSKIEATHDTLHLTERTPANA